jgi:flagellar biosynthesis/type III secretory pathway chaperone
MTTKPDIDTDFNPFDDADELHDRRVTDKDQLEVCPQNNCPNVFILERRVDRHRRELNMHLKHIEELKTLVLANGEQVTKNSEATSEILEIVTLAKSFFKVLGWIGDKLKPLIALIVTVGGVIGIIFASGARWGKQ